MEKLPSSAADNDNNSRPEIAVDRPLITADILMGYLDISPLRNDPDIEDVQGELAALADDMNRNGFAPSDMMNLTKAEFSFWQTTLKQRKIVEVNGKQEVVHEVHTVPNRARKYQLRPRADTIDASEFIITPPPLKVFTTRPHARKLRHEKVAIDLPDIQYDLREHRDGTLTPVHDPRAIDVALQITKDVQPDLIISGGDEVDLAALSRFKPDSTHFMSPSNLRRAVLGMHAILAQIRTDSPNASIQMLSSNHAERWVNHWLALAPELVEVRPADDPEGLPLVSLERALGLKALDINYIAGYNAASYHVNDRLITFHGDKSKNNGSTAQEYLREHVDESVMFHHTHRIEREVKSHKGRIIQAFSNGCLASTQGAVPSYHNSVDTMGEVVPQQENWQNGLGVVHYTEGNGAFSVEQIVIDHNDGYRAWYGGKWYAPRPQAQRTWEQFEPHLSIREFPARAI